MKRKLTCLIALLLAVVLSLTGCAGLGSMLDRMYTVLELGLAVSFEDMEYTRPNLTAFRVRRDETMEQIATQTDVDALMEYVYGMYEYYYSFSTNYNLANIRYCLNMTDVYWEEEYSWCLENSSEITAAMDQMLYALADCALREELESDDYFGEGFFDQYDGESLWDETFTDLMNREAQLLNEYYDLSAQTAEVDAHSEEYYEGCGYQMELVFAQLVQLRQEIAAYAGYASYPEFAYEYYFYRDYSPDQARQFMADIAQELTPLYRRLDSSVWAPLYESCTEEQVFAYVRACAQALGGTAQDAFALMEKADLYDITYSENKYDASFETFLMDYYSPFIFLNPTGSQADQLTFAHEFGHFCNDYAVGGTVAGVDVAEVFSQSLEYLSLCYCADTQSLLPMKMADSLCVFVEQSAYASFEHRIYDLEEPTVESIRAAFAASCADYGLDAWGVDSRAYTMVPHFFISPMYVVSYVISNDAAMQIYQLELEEAGSGAAAWENGLYTMQTGYMAFIEEVGLRSPFAEGRAAELRALFEETLAS